MENATDIKTVPSCPELERQVLSMISLKPQKTMADIIGMGLTEEHFYIPAHRLIWNAYSRRFDNHEAMDVASICNELRQRNELDACGGFAGLSDILGCEVTSAYLKTYIKDIKSAYTRRQIIEISSAAIEAAYAKDKEPDEILDEAEQVMLSVRKGNSTARERTMKAVLSDAISNIENVIKSQGQPDGLPSGFPTLDKLTSGFHRGELFIIAARPSMGKTALMLNIASEVAKTKDVLCFSLEMSDTALAERLVYAESGVSKADLIRGNGALNKGDMKKLADAAKRLSTSRLRIVSLRDSSIGQVRAYARRVKYDNPELAMICVDYLQLMHSNSSQARFSREREVSEVSAGLKSLALELDVTVVALAQLNRAVEGRSGKDKGVPLMSDLRDSGSIEQDADMIGLLYRPAYYASDEEKANMDEVERNAAYLNLAKNRNGATGNIAMHYHAPLMRFVDRAFIVANQPPPF